MESSARCMLEYLNRNNCENFLYDFVGGPWKTVPHFNKNNEIIRSSKKWKFIKIDYLPKKPFYKKITKVFNFNIKFNK